MRDTSNLVDETLAFTEKDINDFLDDTLGDLACPCSRGHFELVCDRPDVPSLMTMKDVREGPNEHWFFWLACNHCSQTRMIAASRVWSWHKDREEKDVK